jgi:hypothetical protein
MYLYQDLIVFGPTSSVYDECDNIFALLSLEFGKGYLLLFVQHIAPSSTPI